MNVAVMGTGYVGLVTGACFAEFGMNVHCVDNDATKIDRLNAGEVPVYEPGLGPLVERNMKAGRLRFSTDLGLAVKESLVVFIAVGTPQDPHHGRADLSHVIDACEQIAVALDEYKVIVTKSTVPVGPGARLKGIILERSQGKATFSIASTPEF